MDILVDIYNWFTTGIYDFFTELAAYAIQWFLIAKIKFMTFMIEFSWHVAENILVNLGISDLISSAWASIDSEILNGLTFFRLPECINIIVQAVVTRFSLKVLI